jgi:hypothetical protein
MVLMNSPEFALYEMKCGEVAPGLFALQSWLSNRGLQSATIQADWHVD